MTITFERRTDRPDAAGRCAIHLRAYFEGQRLRFGTKEHCLASEWDVERAQFRRTFPGFLEANDYLQSLRDRLHAHYRQLRASGALITPEGLKAVLRPPVVTKATPPVVWLTDLYKDYQTALQARGNLVPSLVSVATTLTHLSDFEKVRKQRLQLKDYDVAMHDKFLGYLRGTRKLAQNSVCKSVKHVKAFLRYVHEDLRMPVAVEPRQLKIQWAEVEKVYLTAAELDLLENATLPSALVGTRDAFLFCCYTGLRHSDLSELSTANVKIWDGSRILRLTQTKTRTAVSIYLTPPAAALLDQYPGRQTKLLPVTSNQVMNRNVKRIAELAGLRDPVEVVTVEAGKVMKRQQPKHELISMHTARHTFAVLSLLRGLPVAVLQKVMGHAKIQTTMVYAKVVEDFQHHEMRRVWESGAGVVPRA
ncbi:site-specific integrase [Hymenobacter arizonensis]|uniref:Site-specific recombinase XerD n=1 Tax=Hymenobacter arizonensis TaxID=1227077 RepID=A0A1I5YW38_HYMAR|nr:site-specific integrase [Hymenobacter arizonensis]SFQ48439.1 Site-specific recombinase XerD [Hymenobacter arizonensis]